jgi:hypothetical protein
MYFLIPSTIMAPKRSETKTIDCFEITYEYEGGNIFAFGFCPQCGQKEESMEQSIDAG